MATLERATEKQYSMDSKQPGFASEGQRIDHIVALGEEYELRTTRGDKSGADEVADQLVEFGQDDPRKAEKKPAARRRAAAKADAEDGE